MRLSLSPVFRGSYKSSIPFFGLWRYFSGLCLTDKKATVKKEIFCFFTEFILSNQKPSSQFQWNPDFPKMVSILHSGLKITKIVSLQYCPKIALVDADFWRENSNSSILENKHCQMRPFWWFSNTVMLRRCNLTRTSIFMGRHFGDVICILVFNIYV